MTDTMMPIDLLHGVQEIAEVMNVTPRTAQYWISAEAHSGLPDWTDCLRAPFATG